MEYHGKVAREFPQTRGQHMVGNGKNDLSADSSPFEPRRHVNGSTLLPLQPIATPSSHSSQAKTSDDKISYSWKNGSISGMFGRDSDSPTGDMDHAHTSTSSRNTKPPVDSDSQQQQQYAYDVKREGAKDIFVDTLPTRVQREIDRIYEDRKTVDAFNHSSYATRPLHSSHDTSVQLVDNAKEVVIQRAYVRPTKQAPLEPVPVLSEIEMMKASIAPPLPLMDFHAVDEKQTVDVNTITGEKLRSIPNLLAPNGCAAPRTPLCDPFYSRRIAKWFVRRSFKELNMRQVESYANHFGQSGEEAKPDVLEVPVYESLLFAESLADRRARDAQRIPEEQIFQERWDRLCAANSTPSSGAFPSLGTSASTRDLSTPPGTTGSNAGSLAHMGFTPSLKFDGEFESGNLESAVRVLGRESLLPARELDPTQDGACPGEVDQEYDLTLRKDINTDGNIQWYYFSATAGSGAACTERSTNSSVASSSSSRVPTGGRNTPLVIPNSALTPIKYPLRVRFNITNMQKKDSLYNYGMMPATYSENQTQGEDWVHRGEDVCYYRNGATTIKPSKRKDGDSKKKMVIQYHYTLTFTYTFEQPDTVFFAHTFPFTYSDLQLSLHKMGEKYRSSGFFHRRTLCQTLAGNACDILSISERSAGVIESKNKPAVVLTARVHPGESNSSFMIQGFLHFITSDAPEAVKLRQSFIFHIIPMLNPDGVIHGNYRCSLAATDLNRRYAAPHPKLHPTILAKMNFLKSTAENRNILLYLDLHGHSKLKNAFLYGCDVTLQQEKITKQLIPNMNQEDVIQRRVFSRVFPRILSAVSDSSQDGYFSYRDCSFNIDRGKSGTGRVVCWKELSISASYTIESSFCGNGDNRERSLFKKAFEGAGGMGVYSKAAMASSAAQKKNSTNYMLPRSRADSGAGLSSAGGGGSGGKVGSDGIAYFGGTETHHGGEAVSLDSVAQAGRCDDEEGGVEAPFKSGKKSSSKKEKARSSQRRASTATAAPPKEQSIDSVIDVDAALADLLDRYNKYVHYSKEDLLNMGRDIGLAIFHFANLSHSDIDNELNIATKVDAEAKAKARRLSLMGYSPADAQPRGGGVFMPDSSSEYHSSSTGKLKSRKYYDKRDGTSGRLSPLPNGGSGDMDGGHRGHVRSAAWCGTWSVSGESTGADRDRGIDLAAAAVIGDYDGLDASIENIYSGYTDELVNIEGNAEEAEAEAEEAVLDLDDDSDEEEDLDSESAGESRSGGPGTMPQPASPVKGDTSDSLALVKEYTAAKLRLLEIDMAQRSLLRAGVFSSKALEAAMHQFPAEFLEEKASRNVGMRMKCEYNIRRGLRCAGDITLTDAALRQHDATFSAQVEEENMSAEGSDSNPSVDNVPAMKMLKKIKKFKDSKGLVVALGKSAVRKKKKELESDRKSKKREAKKLARQASDTRRAIEEARVAQAAKDAKNAADLAAQHQASASAMVLQIAENLKEKVSRRKSSIFQSAPKHAPLYRLAPDEARTLHQPLPMKVVNFRDYDAPAPEDGGPAPSRSRKGSDANQEPYMQPQQPPPQPQQHATHSLALSMSSLTSAVNRLYLNGGVPEEQEESAAALLLPPSTVASSGLPSSSSRAMRRNSLHNSQSIPTLLPSMINTAEPVSCPPLTTAAPLRSREGSPRSSAAPLGGMPVQPTVHSMATLVPSTPEPLLRVRERVAEVDYHNRTVITERPTVGRVRPKSGSATASSRRKIKHY